MFKSIIISAPFGEYFNHPYCTSTLGTYTLNYRGGFWKRLWRIIKTVRYNRRTGSWINKLGLPNPGIKSLLPDSPTIINEGLESAKYSNKIISIFGFDSDEWSQLAYHIITLRPLACELNLSCPNISHVPFLKEIFRAVEILQGHDIPIIAKLGPIKPLLLATHLKDFGINIFHACNTLPTPKGGVSGKILKPLSLWAIEYLRDRFGSEITIIGGGGVTTEEDIREYHQAGADHIAVGSMLFNPLNLRKLGRFSSYFKALNGTVL